MEYRSLPNSIVIPTQFRDGEYEVPPYLLNMIVDAGIDTLSVTYEEARRLASQAGMRLYLNGQVNSIVRDHRKAFG